MARSVESSIPLSCTPCNWAANVSDSPSEISDAPWMMRSIAREEGLDNEHPPPRLGALLRQANSRLEVPVLTNDDGFFTIAP